MIERYSRPEMRALWSEEAKYRRWLEVELAVSEVLAEARHRSAPRHRRDQGEGGLRRRAHRRDRTRGAPRRDRLPDERRRARGPRGALAPLRHDLERRDRYGARAPAARRGASAAGGGGARDRGAAPPCARAPPHAVRGTHARRPRRAHDLRSQAARVPRGDAAQPRAARARARRGLRRQALRRGGHVRALRAARGGGGLPSARPRLRAGGDAGGPARPPRGVRRHARADRVLPRQARGRAAPPRAHGGSRGRGGVREGAEGLVRHAPQAQSVASRERVGPRARRARLRHRRAREHRAVARARHQQFVRRTHRAARRHDCPGLHAAAHGAPRRDARRLPRPDASRTSS